MKQGIHPNYVECTVRCTCGNTFKTRSTKPELVIDLCDKCHPFYTGQQKLVDTGGRVQRFADKFGGAAAAQLKKAQEAKAAKAARKARFADRNCLRHTGSRLLSADGNGRRCAMGNGRAFTREDLERTGGMDLGSALRSLHPGIH